MTIQELIDYGFIESPPHSGFYGFSMGNFDYSLNSENMICWVGRKERGYEEEMSVPVNNNFIKLIEFLSDYER